MDLLFVANTTVAPSPSDPTTPIWVGYVAVLVTVFFFGSNLVPAGKYPIGDGLSFQFFLCCGIWITGVIIDLAVSSPPFFPLVMIGGVLWTTGNILSLFVIRINGLGMSMLLWCTTNLLLGWASGHFGWFGLTPENVQKPALNYIGVTIACVSGIVFLAIRNVKHEDIVEVVVDDERQPMLHPTSGTTTSNDAPLETATQENTNVRLRILGCLLAMIAGVMFGLMFTPSTYIQDHRQDKYPSASKNGLHYVFSMYSGILLSSFAYFVIYIIFKRNRPHIHIESILPGFISGIMWGIAQAAFLVANSVLSQTISFPLVMIGPGTVAILWSIFYFKEIVGLRNYLIISVGTLLRIISAVFIVLSKPTSS